MDVVNYIEKRQYPVSLILDLDYSGFQVRKCVFENKHEQSFAKRR